MSNRLRITIAGAVTALFLGAMSAAGLLTHADRPQAPFAGAQPTATAATTTQVTTWHEND